MFETIILSVALLANGNLEVLEQSSGFSLYATTTLAHCINRCPHQATAKIKKIYHAKDGKIELLKEVHQVPVERTKTETIMEFPE